MQSTIGMDTILVAYDFSGCSRAAVRLATALAKRRDMSLLLMHVVAPPPLDLAALPVGTTGWEEDLLRSASTEVEQEASAIRLKGVAVQTRVSFGAPAREILDAAREVGPSLIAMGTHGRKGAAHLILGSVAEQVVRVSRCPVLVTRESIPEVSRWDGSTPLRLTIAADGTPASEAAFCWARTWVQPRARDLSLVRLYWPPHDGARYGIDEPWRGNEGHPDLVRVLERDLRRDARALIGAEDPVMRFRVADHDGAATLAADVRQLEADALVIGVPASTKDAFIPVSASAILRSAPVPVFCVPSAIRPASRQITQVRSVLLPCDLSDSSKAAILPAYGLLPGGGRVELLYVHVVGSRDPLSDVPHIVPLTDEDRAAIEAQLRAQVPHEAADHGISTHVSVIEAGFAHEAILGAAERLDTDMIAMGSHGRSGVARAILGSVAEQVARHSRRPVMIVRAQGGPS